MKLKSVVILLALTMIGSANIFAQTYSHTISVDHMAFHWTVEGKYLAIKISAETEGWVGIGFNPVKMMQGADYIIGYVKEGEVMISDEFGNRTTGHVSDNQLGGTDSLFSFSGSEQDNRTTLEFKIPLNPVDKTDKVIDPQGKTIVLLAYGPKDSFRAGHSYYKTLEVNLADGRYKVIHSR